MGKLTVIVLVLVAALAGCSGSTSATSDAGQKVSEARAGAADVCEQFVKRRLKAPGTATFRDPFGDQISYSGDGEGPITVTASVDSENSFGAKLRSPYVCTVSSTGGDNWKLDSLDLQEAGG